MTVIYIDTLFIENLIVNYLLLRGTSRITGESSRSLRLLLGALAGALYCILIFITGAAFLEALPVKLAVGAIMAVIAFGVRKRFIKLCLVFFGTGAAFGGCVYAIYLLTGSREILISVFLCYAFLMLVFGSSARHGGISRDIVKTEVFINGKRAGLNTLLDTGNVLKDPISGAPVIVCDVAAVRNILPADVSHRDLREPTSALMKLSRESHRFRLIPYSAIGTECGMLLAVKTDKVEIGKKVIKGAVLALSDSHLSESGGYNAIAGT